MSGEQGHSGGPGYLDFAVEVGVGAAREYPVVVRSPAGRADGVMRFPFDELALERRLLTVQNVLLRGIGLTRNVAFSREEQIVEAFGQAMFEALLPDAALNRYDVCRQLAAEEGKGLRLRLQIRDPVLAALPWEFLYDGRRGDYICLSQRTPVVRHLDLPAVIRPLAVASPLRILGMVASPPGLPVLDVARERERVERALAALIGQGLVELVWLAGQTWETLQEAMWDGPWHVFHFVGHGGFDAATGEGHLALALDDNGDEDASRHGGRAVYRLSAVSLARLLADHTPLRLAVLNACEGARASAQSVFSGTAATLVRAGLPAVVAMQYAITDRAAVQFARTFYRALARPQPVDAAVAAARQAVSLAAPESLEWATPVLYLRAPDALLFAIGTTPSSAAPPSVAPPSAAPSSAIPTSEAPAPLVADADAPPERLAALRVEATAAYWTEQWDRAVALLEEYVASRADDRDAAAKLQEARRQQQLAHLYADARELRGRDASAAILRVFARIRKLDPAYPDPEGLEAAARDATTAAEEERQRDRLYRQGLQHLDAAHWREAVRSFEAVERQAPGYGDVTALLRRARREVVAQEKTRAPRRRPTPPRATAGVAKTAGPSPAPRTRPVATSTAPAGPESAFLMSIEDAFAITGRGTVVTGKVERGTLQVGDEVEIVGLSRPTRRTVVTGVEMVRKLIDRAKPGDNVGVLLRAVARTEVERGQVLAQPGSIAPHATFVAHVHPRPAKGSGRPPAWQEGDPAQFSVRTAQIDGRITQRRRMEPTTAGPAVEVDVELAVPVALEAGLAFTVHEKGEIVADGIVVTVGT